MNVSDANNLFREKINSIPQGEDDFEPFQIRFLQLAIDYCTQASDKEVGSFEVPSAKIAYNGYYANEDEKEFHIVGLAFFQDPTVSVDVITTKIKGVEQTAYALARQAFLSESERIVNPISQIQEHMNGLKDASEEGYKLFFDFFTNADLPESFTGNKYSYEGHEFQVLYYGAQDVAEAINGEDEESLLIDFKNKYQKPLKVVKISSTNDFDVYMGGIEGRLLADVYRDHKSSLMDGNVRAYLKRTQKVNKGISETIRTNPAEFVAFNNGLSTVAEGGKSSIIPLAADGYYQINSLSKFQIVNGGQTTVTIYMCANDPVDLEDVVVPIKITVLKRGNNEADLVANVAEFANTQTAIKKSDLASNKPFYKLLETLSLNVAATTGGVGDKGGDPFYWFFERTAGLYNTKRRLIWNFSKSFEKKYPEKKKFSKSLLAKAVNACSADPVTVCFGNEKSFETFNKTVLEKESQPDESYYKRLVASIILWRETDKIIKKEHLPIKAAVAPYTIAALAYYSHLSLDLDLIWETQTITQTTKEAIKQIAILISGYFVSVQNEHPNTLMYARKKECWEMVKKLVKGPIEQYLVGVPMMRTPYSFFPESPAATFINDDRNFFKSDLWFAIENWNDKTSALSKYEQTTCHDLGYEIRISGKSSVSSAKRKKGREIYLKASRNGFKYFG